MHSVYGVSNVTDQEKMARAVREMTAGAPCMYAIIQVEESVNRASSLRQWIDNDGHIAQLPTDVGVRGAPEQPPANPLRVITALQQARRECRSEPPSSGTGARSGGALQHE